MNLSRCSFSNNYVSANDSGGGALSMGIEPYSINVSSNNNITVTEATFFSNTGYYAGGVLVYCNALDPDKSIKSYNYVTFIESNWENNSGTASPAVYVEPNFKSQYYSTFTTITTFENCSFSNNTIQRYYDPAKAPSYTFKEDVGVFVIAKLTVYFKGTAGGAIRLMGYSNIHNSASFVGGAIFVSIKILYSSQSCFLQYRNDDEKEHSYETNAHFTFIDNWSSTRIADSIFLNTIKPCQLACVTLSGSVPNPTELFQNQSCIGKFDIENNEIASGGSLFKINQSVNFSIVPGRTFSLPLTLFDDMGQNVTNRTIFQPSLSSGSNINVSSGFEYVADNKIQFTGKPGESSNLTLKIPGTDTGASIGIKLAPCPPGYIYDSVSSSCVCSASQSNKSLTYKGIVGCIENKGVAISGYWVGYILSNENEKPNQMNLYTTDCPLGFCNYNNTKAGHGRIKQDYSLAENACREEMDKALMHHMAVSVNGAVGFRPAIIRSIYTVIYNMFNLNFFDIDELSFCLWKGASTLDIISINLTTGSAYNFIFMIQLMHHMVVSVNGAVEFKPAFIVNIYTVIYNMFNLNFFDIDELSFCLWKGASTLDIISIKLKGKQCCKSTSSYSVVQGLTAFLVMSYFQCSRISFILLNKGTPHGIGGKLYRPLVFWDGSLEYFSPHHLQYAIPAIISLIIFIIPFPLILTFDGLLLKIESKVAIRFAFIRRFMPWTAIHYRLKPLLDSFQGPFKDQYRFFAGLYFFYRFIVLSLLVLASMALVVFLVIQAMARPFQEKSHNVCALLVFTNITFINGFTMRIYYLLSNYGYTAETITMQWIQMGLIYVPLFAAVIKTQNFAFSNYEELSFNRIRILCYARKHKYPENRSALTYWEEEAPSRLNLGKDKYGGPFTMKR
uniref:Uncharacterized protein n=1 Tax=Amphimedon queenslandica TaxID=400682 RepID=A0A1X7VDS3_AMPQE